MSDFDVTPGDVQEARNRIARVAARTPLIRSRAIGRRVGKEIFLKLECVQQTGSFKVRGAANRMLALTHDERRRGVVAVSSGNHGRAVAHVAAELGIRAVVCLAETVPSVKVEGIREYGAEVQIVGKTYDAADEHALSLQRERGLVLIHPYDEPHVIAGQGTIALEVLEDLPDVDTVLVPLSGGGLISGIALAVKSANPAIKVIGVMMDRSPAMYHALEAGRIVEIEEQPTLADALAGGLGETNRLTIAMCQRLVDEVVLVSEEEIAAAMRFMLEVHRLVVEGGGAVGIAAVMSRRFVPGNRSVVVLSGSNVGLATLLEIAGRTRDDDMRGVVR
jgi:threonine dehydratase